MRPTQRRRKFEAQVLLESRDHILVSGLGGPMASRGPHSQVAAAGKQSQRAVQVGKSL